MNAKGVLSPTEKVQYACKESLKFLCKEILWLNHPDEMKLWGQCHSDIEAHLKAGKKFNLIEIPRDHLKSSVITIPWAIQQVLRNPNIRILIANAVWDNARKFLRSIQQYMGKGSTLAHVFGPFESDLWNADEMVIRQRTMNLVAPTITTTGIEKFQTSQHYDLIIADDLHGLGNIETDNSRQKVKDYFNSLFDLLDKKNGRMVVIGTPWHQDDLYATLEGKGHWHLFKRDIFGNDLTRKDIPYTEKTLLFPEKMTHEIVADLRKNKDSYTFSSQYLLNPIDESTSLFKKSMIRYYEEADVQKGLSLFLSVDPAISQKSSADFTAMMVCGKDRNGRIYVRDRVREKAPPDQIVKIIFDLIEKWKLTRIGIETYGFQMALKYAVQAEQRRRNKYFVIEEMKKPKEFQNKQVFISRLQPLFEQGLIYLRHDMTDVVEELLSFPRGRHDDLLDALAFQLDYLVTSTARSVPTNTKEGTYQWWIDNHMKTKSTQIYGEFLKDLKEVRATRL